LSFTPEDRNAELRGLFFESANELLQSLNESGLELEARPADEEIIRSVRRVVHTLKGDSAACGFTKLSEISHELEDVLTPQMGAAHGLKFAEVVLVAADTFEAMLSAYQRGVAPPSVDPLRLLIRQMLDAPVQDGMAVPSIATLPARFEWSEYEQLMISEAIHRGEMVFNVALRIDQNSGMRAAAFQLIRNVLHG
jgi:two-component system chemotaxis sensor kinase CheA